MTKLRMKCFRSAVQNQVTPTVWAFASGSLRISLSPSTGASSFCVQTPPESDRTCRIRLPSERIATAPTTISKYKLPGAASMSLQSGQEHWKKNLQCRIPQVALIPEAAQEFPVLRPHMVLNNAPETVWCGPECLFIAEGFLISLYIVSYNALSIHLPQIV